VVTLTASVTVHDSGPEPYTLLELAGEADIVSSTTLHSVLEAETSKGPSLLVIEMSGLRYMDSAALQEIVRANLALRAEGGRLALVGPHDNVAKVLQLTEVDQLVPVYASLAEAAPAAPTR
jgi:anti-sigma B factor antagonist